MKFFRTKGSLSTAVDLSHYSGGADRIVVIDTETTGVLPFDRVVEIAEVAVAL
jgi:DNA polymerase III epsilon subunit-like protein